MASLSKTQSDIIGQLRYVNSLNELLSTMPPGEPYTTLVQRIWMEVADLQLMCVLRDHSGSTSTQDQKQ